VTITAQAPVLVGIGTATQREDDPTLALEPVALMIQAARRAGLDIGNPSALGEVERILVPKGRWCYGDPAREIARAIGTQRAVTVLSTIGVLQQSLIADTCRRIADGEIDTALVIGGDTGYRILRSTITGIPALESKQGDAPDILFAPHHELRHPAELRAGLKMPVGLYAIIESAFRARRRWSIEAHRDRLAALYARFSEIAANNPEAWTKQSLSAEEIRSTSDRNPMQALPYTKHHCSSWNVDQAAALVFCSAQKAEALSIARERWIFPWASTESNHMVPVCARAELDRCPGARIAGEATLAPFGLDVTGIDLIELYSCFPIAVEAYAAELGIDPAQDLTVTGGMSFAGGPYNNYVLQATARMVKLLRQGRGRTGLVSSVSGVLTKQGFGLWSTQPAPEGFRFADVTEEVARVSVARDVAMDPAGPARVAGYTVLHDRGRPPIGVAILDLAEGRRAVASSDDAALISRMQDGELCGAAVTVDGAGFRLAVEIGERRRGARKRGDA
jgi:acetyl-CoA C-acetyltransferase